MPLLVRPAGPPGKRMTRSGHFRGIKTKQAAQISDPEGAVVELGNDVSSPFSAIFAR